MITIKEYEDVKKLDSETINYTLYKAYCDYKAEGRETIDFNDAIWDTDVKAIADTLRGAGIREFTISVNQTNMAEILAAFNEAGVVIQGIVRVKKHYNIPGETTAFLMRVEQRVGAARKDLSGTIWDKDIPTIVKAMKDEGIAEFTISDTSCGMVNTLAVFETNGAKLQGLTRIKSGWCNFETGEDAMKPAFLMKIL